MIHRSFPGVDSDAAWSFLRTLAFALDMEPSEIERLVQGYEDARVREVGSSSHSGRCEARTQRGARCCRDGHAASYELPILCNQHRAGFEHQALAWLRYHAKPYDAGLVIDALFDASNPDGIRVPPEAQVRASAIRDRVSERFAYLGQQDIHQQLKEVWSA